MVTEAEGESYEAENDTDTGVDVEDEDEGAEEDEQPEAAAEPEIDYKAKYAELDRINADKAVALRAERTRARNAERQLAEMRAEIAALKAPKTEIPDVSADPIGALEAIREAIIEQNKPKTIDPKEQHQARLTELQQMEMEYAAENPEYNDAAQFFGSHLREELETQGYSGADLDTEFGTQLMKLVSNAEKAGKHPGDVIMALAKKNGFGKPVIDKGAEKIDKMKAAKAASASLGSAPANGNRNLTVEYVNSLPMGPEKTAARQKLIQAAIKAERRA